MPTGTSFSGREAVKSTRFLTVWGERSPQTPSSLACLSSHRWIPLKSLQHPRAQLGFDPPHTAPHSKSSNQSYKAPDLSKLQSA
ncbi:hypothetical protein PCANC_23038 [Puccinia coronata f. sp. avenae]|uniref:Uncharacterized protein n=1 Tax=Puccinia coronata f. sp. avenae TaxID=200324 RepID=A0A2N5TRB0_9BASI|nr:hypothetical protein PCANC_23038 [Puccinia coronata f. sp. avenae]